MSGTFAPGYDEYSNYVTNTREFSIPIILDEDYMSTTVLLQVEYQSVNDGIPQILDVDVLHWAWNIGGNVTGAAMTEYEMIKITLLDGLFIVDVNMYAIYEGRVLSPRSARLEASINAEGDLMLL